MANPALALNSETTFMFMFFPSFNQLVSIPEITSPIGGSDLAVYIAMFCPALVQVSVFLHASCSYTQVLAVHVAISAKFLSQALRQFINL